MSLRNNHYTLPAIAELAFKEFHGFEPYQWQIQAAVHSLQQDTGEANPGPLLMVRSTGGGKSAVRNVLGFLREGVSLTIVPLLSLGACFWCRSDLESRRVFAPVSRQGLTKVLVALFANAKVKVVQRCSVLRSVVTLLQTYPSFSDFVYLKPTRKHQPVWEVKLLLLKLLAA
jgi:hypothetical protein